VSVRQNGLIYVIAKATSHVMLLSPRQSNDVTDDGVVAPVTSLLHLPAVVHVAPLTFNRESFIMKRSMS